MKLSNRPLRNACLGLALLALAACGKPVPQDKQAYVGTWSSEQMLLQISQEGRVVYKRKVGDNGSKSMDAPIKDYKGNDIVAGVGPLETTFVVSVPPHQDAGAWKMTVDGVELTRQ